MNVAPRRFHLVAPAGSCREFLDVSGIGNASKLIQLVRDAVGPSHEVTGDTRLIDAEEDERRGGRHDDQARADDLTNALADDNVAAIVAIRGGAWLTRALPRIDFSVLERRIRPVLVCGFSEITTLVNLVASYSMGRGVYDNAPVFLTYGLRQYAATRAAPDELAGLTPHEWMRRRLPAEFQAFFRDVAAMVEGRGTQRTLTGQVVGGTLPSAQRASFVGGNLTVFITLLGSSYQDRVLAPPDESPDVSRWIVLEDYRESSARLDRMIAQLTLAGVWETCDGILLGDFHRDEEDLTDAVVSLLRFHLPVDREVPILGTYQLGHIWPMHPLPLRLPVTIQRTGDADFSIAWSPDALCTV